MEVEILHQFKPILERENRFYIFLGGRSSGKSWGIADTLLLLGRRCKERILCTREIQKSIETSSYQLLVDRINHHGYADYEITKTSIKNKITGTEFIFAGLSDITGTADSLKSIENISCCWCFPAGTKVGNKNIENIKVGQFVDSYNHKTKKIEKKKVLRIMKRKMPKNLIKVLTHDGLQYTIATEEHPFYVKGKGYIKAKDLKTGDIVYEKVRFTENLSMLRRMRDRITFGETLPKNKICEIWRVLLSRLRKKEKFRENEKTKPYVKFRNEGKDDKETSFNGTQTNDIRRKWKRLYTSSENTCKRAWERLVARITDTNGTLQRREQPSDKLQSGYSKHLLWYCNRIRRELSSRGKSTNGRRKENKILREQRVESVEILESSSLKRLRLSDGGNYVYNIEVQGNNNYFANGLLVHNCEEAQTVSDKSFEKLTPSIRGKNSLGEGSIIIISYNPETVNDPVHLRFIESEQPRSYICHINYLDNPYCPKEIIEEAEAMKKNKPDDYKRIWLGVPDDFSNRAVVKYFSNENICNINYLPDEDLILTMDFNVDPMMWCVCHKDENNLYQFDEIVIDNCTTQDAINEFINRYPDHKGNIILCGDASGNYRKTQSNQSDYVICKNALMKHGYEKIIQNTRPFNPPINQRIKAFNQLVYDDNGERHYFVSENCKWTLYNLRNLLYKEGTSIIDLPTPARIQSDSNLKYMGHIFDAISYPAEYYWSIKLDNNEKTKFIDPSQEWTMAEIIKRNTEKKKW